MLTKVEPSRRRYAVIAHHRARKQIWLAHTRTGGTRNSHVLVFDYTQGIFSLYDIPADFLVELEDNNDEPKLYAGIRGFLCELDYGTRDGPQDSSASLVGSATAGSTSSLMDGGKSWSVDGFKGHRVWWYDRVNQVVRSAFVRKNSTTVLSFETSAAVAPAAGDPYVIGGISFFSDFVADFGGPLAVKRLLWGTFAGVAPAISTTFQVAVAVAALGRSPSFTSVQQATWGTSTTFLRMWLGSLARVFRVRISDAGTTPIAAGQVFPSIEAAPVIADFALDAEVTTAR
jgi:hypothetical protein